MHTCHSPVGTSRSTKHNRGQSLGAGPWCPRKVGFGRFSKRSAPGVLLLRVTLENMKDDVGSAGISAGLEARAGGGCNLRNAVGGLGSRQSYCASVELMISPGLLRCAVRLASVLGCQLPSLHSPFFRFEYSFYPNTGLRRLFTFSYSPRGLDTTSRWDTRRK